MHDKTSQKVKVGIFTSVTILLLLVGIFLIGRNKNMFRSTITLYSTFKNVGGLQVGNNIRFVGIDVGTVDNIDILSDSTARVTLIIQKKVQPYIKKGAIASISSDGLMGDKLVAISSGTNSNVPVKDGETINAVDPMQFDKVLDRLSGVAANAEVITGQLAGIATQVNQGKGSIGRLLYSDSMANDLEGTVNEAKKTMKAVHKGSEGFSENMEALKHNFLLRGYFRKKEKAAKEAKEKQQEQQEKKEKQEKKNAKKKSTDSTTVNIPKEG
ncbi:MlaD family protein [Chitinophaga silvisoli]|uniref:MCE family protein n=1 Tax=Chitinophaga silvisoli TaxID=2291814 RepID=A0A3E1NVC3_9BACT|nr:MlaD family protein [Chitinophaga silvisoli]RFM31901.1 MCE family protein [Chitinophaga silvisoli]